jgi:hypothetical protein
MADQHHVYQDHTAQHWADDWCAWRYGSEVHDKNPLWMMMPIN